MQEITSRVKFKTSKQSKDKYFDKIFFFSTGICPIPKAT